MTAFAPNDTAAERSTGLQEKTTHRTQAVCARALSDLKETRIREILQGLQRRPAEADQGLFVVKRSSDETSFWLQGRGEE